MRSNGVAPALSGSVNGEISALNSPEDVEDAGTTPLGVSEAGSPTPPPSSSETAEDSHRDGAAASIRIPRDTGTPTPDLGLLLGAFSSAGPPPSTSTPTLPPTQPIPSLPLPPSLPSTPIAPNTTSFPSPFGPVAPQTASYPNFMGLIQGVAQVVQQLAGAPLANPTNPSFVNPFPAPAVGHYLPTPIAPSFPYPQINPATFPALLGSYPTMMPPQYQLPMYPTLL